jgi:hypothetical protein
MPSTTIDPMESPRAPSKFFAMVASRRRDWMLKMNFYPRVLMLCEASRFPNVCNNVGGIGGDLTLRPASLE